MARRSQQDLSKIRGFVSFLSSSGNGHSLISSMIDAHRDAVVCREKHILTRVYSNEIPDKRKVFNDIINTSHTYTVEGRYHKGSQTSHIVPNQFNGRSKQPQIVGDKHGYGVTMMLNNHKDFIEVVEQKLGIPVYFIHVHRNPYDVIAHLKKFKPWTLESTIRRMLTRFRCVDQALSSTKNSISVSFESFIFNVPTKLPKILNFLGLENYDGFVEDCQSIVERSKVFEWNEINWDPKQINRIERFCKPYPYLRCQHG